jgi:hypothetical protein
VGHPLWREDGSATDLYNCLWALPEQSPLGRSPAKLTAIFYCLIWDSPIWRARSPYLHPPGTGWLSYIPGHCVSFSSPLTTRRYSNPPQVKVILRPTISRPVRLGVVPLLESVTRCYISLSDNYFFYFSWRRPLWRVQWHKFSFKLYCDRHSVGQFTLVTGPNGAHDQILISLFDNYFLSSRCRTPSPIFPHEQGDPARSQSQKSK